VLEGEIQFGAQGQECARKAAVQDAAYAPVHEVAIEGITRAKHTDVDVPSLEFERVDPVRYEEG
jgi:hypothetical protein